MSGLTNKIQSVTFECSEHIAPIAGLYRFVIGKCKPAVTIGNGEGNGKDGIIIDIHVAVCERHSGAGGIPFRRCTNEIEVGIEFRGKELGLDDEGFGGGGLHAGGTIGNPLLEGCLHSTLVRSLSECRLHEILEVGNGHLSGSSDFIDALPEVEEIIGRCIGCIRGCRSLDGAHLDRIKSFVQSGKIYEFYSGYTTIAESSDFGLWILLGSRPVGIVVSTCHHCRYQGDAQYEFLEHNAYGLFAGKWRSLRHQHGRHMAEDRRLGCFPTGFYNATILNSPLMSL